jgi:hypothetical protein
VIADRQRSRRNPGLPVFGATLLVVAGILVLAATSSAATSATPTTTGDPYLVAARVITCPHAPIGFKLLRGSAGRFVLTPLSSMNESPGGTSVQVTCNYVTQKGGVLLAVAVRYALPTNVNPFNDFDIGCTSLSTQKTAGSGSLPWSTQGRIYRVASPTSWSFASFDDSSAVLTSTDEPAFETIAQTMLESAGPIAHNCKLANTAPQAQTVWTFSFNAHVQSHGLTTTGGTLGTFVTAPQPGGEVALGALKARDIVLKISQGTQTVGSMTVALTRAVSFDYSAEGALKAAVLVKSSTYAPCHSGTTGLLTVAVTTRTVTLQVCNRNLFAGTGVTGPSITN